MHATVSTVRPRHAIRSVLIGLATVALLVGLIPAAGAQSVPGTGSPTSDDPRVGLGDGYDAEQASLALDLIGQLDKQGTPFFDDGSLSPNVGLAINTANSDIAFTGDHVIHGNWQGFQIYDISDPTNPALRTSVRCPGGQGDVTVIGDLMFTSVEAANGRVDCGSQGNEAGAQDSRMRGIRIWDISDLDNPSQVGVVQLCRGSHTHRLVEDLDDPSHVYLYNNGTAGQRDPGEAVHTPEGFVTGRCGQTSPDDPNPSQWMIEVIRVPVANPGAAEVVDEVRLFQDFDTGAVDGLQNTPFGTPHPCASSPEGCGPATPTFYSPNPNTNTCHDITVYPEIGLAAGACQGNGLLIDISDPANPVRIDEVSDVNFSYWHSANFSNDGTKVMFTDEWGGGTGARCRDTDRLEWGANALFDIVDTADGKKLEFASYYKMPAVQSVTENCVAHQANIVPVPGRDIMVQAWYQGGISMFDWTDASSPFEIGYFDRGPIDASQLILGGHWSGYWYNGQIYGAEIARGLDVLDMSPTAQLTQNEIDAANTVVLDEHNAMSMRRIEWAPSFAVVRAYTDQAERAGLRKNHLDNVRRFVDRAEQFSSGPQARAAIANLRAVANQVDNQGFATLADGLRELADSMS